MRKMISVLIVFLTSLIMFSAETCSADDGVKGVSNLAQPGKKAGERLTFEWNGVTFAFRWCPPGTFLMGSPKEEPNREDIEYRHPVTLTKGFWILETEVTQAMYKAVTGTNPSQFKGETLPVDTVSWHDANTFCRLVIEKVPLPQGVKMTLPTEAQWEYACRAGTQTTFAGPLEKLAWMGEPTETGSTHPVGTKTPNAWGIFDMHGNLWEWCADLYEDFTNAAPKTDPTGPSPEKANSDVRIDRGGCWDSTPEYCRAAHRGVYEPDRSGRFVGFRGVIVER